MKDWLAQKLSDFTSRKFVSFVIVEFIMYRMIHGKMLTDPWAILIGVIGPFILYVYLNGSIELKNLEVNLEQFKIKGGPDVPVSQDGGKHEDPDNN